MSIPGENKPGDAEPAVPPYEGRSAGTKDTEDTEKDGARTAGATGPVDDPEPKAADPADTERGATASPSDEQPAAETPDGESEEATVGPAHTPGTGKGEEKSGE